MTSAEIKGAFADAVKIWSKFDRKKQLAVHDTDQKKLYGLYKYVQNGPAYARNKPSDQANLQELWKWDAWFNTTANVKTEDSAMYTYSNLVFAYSRNDSQSNGSKSGSKSGGPPPAVAAKKKWDKPTTNTASPQAGNTANKAVKQSEKLTATTTKSVAATATATMKMKKTNTTGTTSPSSPSTPSSTKRKCSDCGVSTKSSFSKSQWAGKPDKMRRCKSCLANKGTSKQNGVGSAANITKNDTKSSKSGGLSKSSSGKSSSGKSNKSGKKTNQKEFSLFDSFPQVSLKDSAALAAATSSKTSSAAETKKNKSEKKTTSFMNLSSGTFTKEQTRLRSLLVECSISTEGGTAKMMSAARSFATAVSTAGVASLSSARIASVLSENFLQSKDKAIREAGVHVVSSIVDQCGFASIGALINVVPLVLALTGDKKGPMVREAAAKASHAMFNLIPKEAIPVFITQVLLEGKQAGLAPLSRPETKIISLQMLSRAAKRAPKEIETMLVTLVPILSKAMWDVKKSVKEQAEETLGDVANAMDNMDVHPFIPQLVDAIADPDIVPDIVYALAGTTFVQTVTASALSLTVPLLKRGFKDSKTAIRRKCAVITENMAKLVKNPVEVAPFMPVLAPLLEDGIRTISDPECRQRFQAASETLNRVGAKGEEDERPQLAGALLVVPLRKSMKKHGALSTTLEDQVVVFVADVAASLGNVQRNFISSFWISTLNGLITSCFDTKNPSKSASDAIEEMCAFAVNYVGVEVAGGETKSDSIDENDMNDGREDICDLHFSLAYGSMILLNNSRLHLRKGCKYGVISEKSAGKTTMMRAISKGQVEGFPTQQTCRSIFIENDIQGSQLEMNVREFLVDSIGFGIVLTTEEAEEALKVGGFNQVMCDGKITQLSGGWKMKLALIRATLEKADIMLMDEPTNHLDVINVQVRQGERARERVIFFYFFVLLFLFLFSTASHRRLTIFLSSFFLSSFFLSSFFLLSFVSRPSFSCPSSLFLRNNNNSKQQFETKTTNNSGLSITLTRSLMSRV